MKIAIPFIGEIVSQHYGQSEGFQMFTIENQLIVKKETIKNGGIKGCEGAKLLKEYQITTVILGGAGENAIANLKAQQIEVLSGAMGSVDEVIDAYLSGHLTLNPNAVHKSHHDGDHHHEEGCCGGHHH